MSTRTTRVIYDLVARDRASRTFGQVGGAATRLQRTGAGVGTAIATGLKVGTLAAGGLAFASLKASGDFEKAMNQVKAVTNATGKDFTDLRDEAKELGKTTKFSATQAADGMGFLAMAGFRTKDILSAMPGVLNLASAGNMDLAQSADIASNILTGYGFKAKDTGKVVDILAKTFTSTNTNLTQLGDAMKYAGPVAHSAGVKFEEASAAIGLMGNAGIQASMAGTSLRGSISRLLAPTDKIQGALDKLGVKVTDSSGKMLPLADIIDQLGKKGATTSDLMTIFGQRAGPAMAALIDQGAPALRKLTGQLEHAGGTADRIAKTQMKGLQGGLTSLKSAWEGLLIQVGDTGLLTVATKGVEGVTNALRGLTGFIGKEGVPAAKRFGTALGNMVPLDSLKTKFSQAKTLVGEFFAGLTGGGAKKAKSPIDKFPTTVLGIGTGAPHLGSFQTSSTKGAGAALALAPHFGVGQVAPTTGVQGPALAPQPHGGSGLAAPLVKPKAAPKKSAAQQLGETIRKGVSGGIEGLDFNKLGSKLGDGLAKAVGSAAKGAVKLTEAFGSLMGKIDWVGVGISIGKFVPSLLVGFAAGLLNFDLGGLLKGLGKHWQDVLFAVVAVAFLPAKWVGAIGKWLTKIPFVGKLLSWGFGAFAKVSKGLVKGAGKLLGSIGKGLLGGLAHVFPGVASGLDGLFGKIALSIVGNAGRFGASAIKLAKSIGPGLLKGAEGLGGVAGRVLGQILRPFAGAGRLLWTKGVALATGLKNGAVAGAKAIGGWAKRTFVDPVVNTVKSWFGIHSPSTVFASIGRNLVSGLKGGVTGAAKAIGAWAIRTIVTPVLNRFTTSGSWLYTRGKQLVSGLASGSLAIAKGLGGWMSRHVKSPITGVFKYAGSWLTSKGGAIISGLKNGILSPLKTISKWIKSHVVDPVVGAVKKWFGIKSPSTVFAGIGGHLVGGLLKGLSIHNGTTIAKKVFGDLPHALGAIVKKGLVSVTKLPGKALKALGGLGGDILSFLGLGGGGGGGSKANQRIGQALAAAYGWSGPQWAALKNLWNGESGWNEKAYNKSSGATGIPQSLPGSKMASAGADWRTNPATQIKWGLRYIKSRYGNPINAYSAWLSRSPHWYDAGGIASGTGYMAKNTLKPERVLSPQQTKAFDRFVELLDSGQIGGSGGRFEGELVLDSGELLGLIKGTVKPLIKASEDRAAFRQKVGNR